jgi:penicillin-binding protein 2
MEQVGQRVALIGAAIFILCGALFARAFWLQVVEGEHYAAVSESNAGQRRILRPARGVLVDRHGVVLATNRPSFDLGFLPRGVARTEYEAVASRLATLLGQDSAPILAEMVAARRRPFNVAILASDIPRRLVPVVAERKFELPGVVIEERALRHYPLGAATAHLLGYIGEISSAEIDRDQRYMMGDWVGRAGVEVALEEHLSGAKGYEDVEVDALGQTVRRLFVKPATAGARVTLTVDADLQRWTHEAFAGKQGALVAIEPASGRILALYSAPSYDPNVFVDRALASRRAPLFADTGLPLYNRALQAVFSPGSTFKTVTMIAGLMTGKLRPATRFSCGGMHAGMKCWKAGGHGSLDLVRAYQNSCNVYFYKAGEAVWIEPIHRAARGLGLDQFPGFGLGPEAHGVVPTPEWEQANVPGPDGQHWGGGDVRNTAIGQGYVSVSPAQMARLAAASSMGGILTRPQVFEKIEAPDGRILGRFEGKVVDQLDLTPEAVATIRAAMKAVVASGTGRRSQVPGLSVGGKTGTAQNPHGADHAWFIAAAPMEDPGIALCVMVEHAGMGGGAAAAPIAQYVLERYARKEGWIPK